MRGTVAVRGWVDVWRVDAAGERTLVSGRRNVLTHNLFTILQGLLRQQAADTATQKRVGSIWFEMNNSTMPDPSETDTAPHSASNPIVQVEIDPDDVTAAVVETSAGSMWALVFTASLAGDTWDGNTVNAVNLCTYGDGTLPDPTTFTNGQSGVYLIARQAQSVPIGAGSRWDFAWTISFGAAPEDTVIEEE